MYGGNKIDPMTLECVGVGVRAWYRVVMCVLGEWKCGWVWGDVYVCGYNTKFRLRGGMEG